MKHDVITRLSDQLRDLAPLAIPALLYHGFVERPTASLPDSLFIEVSAFRRQLVSLLDRGFHPVSEAEFLAPGTKVRRRVLITIDDGFRSVFELALPVLEELHVPALLCVPPALVPAEGRGFLVYQELMTGAELAQLARHGVTVAAHGLDHCDLRRIADRELVEHLEQSRRGVAGIAGYQPRVVAYPGGSYDHRVTRAARQAGFEAGLGVTKAMGRFGIPRINVPGSWSPRRLHLELLAVTRVARQARLRMLRR